MGPEKADALAKLEARDPKQSGGVVDLMMMEGAPALIAGGPGIAFLLSNKDMLT
jgi:hypothetical protein